MTTSPSGFSWAMVHGIGQISEYDLAYTYMD